MRNNYKYAFYINEKIAKYEIDRIKAKVKPFAKELERTCWLGYQS